MRYLPAFLIAAFLFSCGTDYKKRTIPIDKPDGGDQGSEKWNEVKALTDQFCIRCHDSSNFLKSEAGFKAASVKQVLESQSMPLSGSAEASSITDENYATMLALFE
jgi:hypothetical protein